MARCHLRERLTRLEAELASVVEPFQECMDHWFGRVLTVAAVDQQLTVDIAQLQEAVRELTRNQVTFRGPAIQQLAFPRKRRSPLKSARHR